MCVRVWAYVSSCVCGYVRSCVHVIVHTSVRAYVCTYAWMLVRTHLSTYELRQWVTSAKVETMVHYVRIYV